MFRTKIITPEKAAEMIPDNATVAISGDGEMVLPDGVLAAIESRFLAEQHPKSLTAIFPIILGASTAGRGADRLSHDGLVNKVISSSLYTLRVRKINQKIIDGRIIGYHLPMGTVFRILRATAEGEKGFVTKVGLKTFVDPDDEGGKVNANTPKPLSQLVKIDNDDYLYYPSIPVNVSIIRGTTADEYGNVTYEKEAITSGCLTMAMAAKSSGGITIAQVKYLAKGGSLHPKSVVIPAPLVDFIVLTPEQQETVEICDPAFTGEIRAPHQMIPIAGLSASKVITRRAYFELQKGKMYNLGVGIPADLPNILVEEDQVDEVFFSVEHGPIGGIPFGKMQFGASTNPLAVLDTVNALEMYDGGCLDGAFLGIAEIDENGNVNVSRLDGFMNIGGFMDIVHKTPKIVFCGTFSSGGLELEIKDSKLSIIHEGKHNKFIKSVNQKSFDADRSRNLAQDITYITERAVFKLTTKGIEITEIAPGIDLKRDILDQMNFSPQVSPNLAIMDARCFGDGPMNTGIRE